MHRGIFAAIVAAASLVAASAHAEGFCEGFQAGWKAAFENHGKIVGITPICPIPPIGHDSFQGGYEAGLMRALAQIAERGG